MFADQDSVQMLQRSSQIGEFYRMSPPEVWDGNPLPPTYMDIMYASLLSSLMTQSQPRCT